MAYPQERRTQVFTGPRFDNRPFRKGTVQGFSQKQNLNPMLRGADAAAMLEDQMGMKADSQGNWGSVRDYGRDMMLASQQRNSLSRGTPGGYASGLANPLNSNLTPRDFSQQLQQRNQGVTREQNIAQAQREGTFGTIRDKFNLDNAGAGLTMNEFGNITKINPLTQPQSAAALPSYLKRPTPTLDPDTPGGASAAARAKMLGPKSVMGSLTKGMPSFAPKQTPNMSPKMMAPEAKPATTGAQDANRQALEQRAEGLKLLREMSQTPLQIDRKAGGGVDTLIQGKYGKGFAANAPPGVKRPAGYEGDVNGRPFSEVMRGLATKQVREGTWREGDALPYEEQNDALNPNATRRSVKDVTEENRQKILSRQRLAAKNR